MTLAELSARSGTSVEAIVEHALGGSKRRSAAEGRGAKPPVMRASGIDTRTAEGRAKFDASILDALRKAGDLASAVELRKQVGGTALQVRTALNRLIDLGEVVFEGKARATRYAVA